MIKNKRLKSRKKSSKKYSKFISKKIHSNQRGGSNEDEKTFLSSLNNAKLITHNFLTNLISKSRETYSEVIKNIDFKLFTIIIGASLSDTVTDIERTALENKIIYLLDKPDMSDESIKDKLGEAIKPPTSAVATETAEIAVAAVADDNGAPNLEA